MNNKKYDIKEKEFEPVIELLKNLPKIEAPDNFEYNLMVKIQNKNFALPETKKTKKWLLIFGPAGAVVLSTFLVLFFFTENFKNSDDPFNFEPGIRQNAGVQTVDTLKVKEYIVENAQDNKKTDINNQSSFSFQQKAYTVVVQPNDVVKKSASLYPLDDSKSVDLDKILSGENANNAGNSKVRLVSEGNDYYPMDEFLVKQTKDTTVKSLKARVDSLKKAVNKNRNK
ncbi:MAG: hypothetical protein V1773_17480 [bacterium]